jgi:penicillin-binding protein 2
LWTPTVLQLARATAALADDGRLRRLHLVRERRDGYNAPWSPLPEPAPRRISDNAAHLAAVREGMVDTMVTPHGTGYSVGHDAPYLIAGKTGTAQKVSRKGNVSVNPHSLPLALRHQAWFIGYAPADNPTIAVAVAGEHGGFGSSTAAPIARKIMDAWLLGTMPAPPLRNQAGEVPGADFGNVHGTANSEAAALAATRAPVP